MSKRLLFIFFIFFALSICSCGLFGKNEAEKKFNEVISQLDSSINLTVTEDLELPKSINGVTLTWTSNNPDVITNDGKVTRGNEDVVVTLTVRLTYEKDNKTLYYNITVKANPTYIITFNSQGGSFVESITAQPNTPITKPTDPTRDGYNFLGWYESESSEEEYVFTTMPNRNITLYARWEKKETYTITFDSQGGSEVNSITAEANTPITKPADPTKDGYIFIGWYESESSEEPYVFITMPNYYLTLYARWEKIKETYTITFDSRGGSHVESITAEPDSPITKPENPTREGYVFLGWYENITSKEPYAFSTMPNNNITLYGRWEEIILGTEGLEYESQLDGTYKVTDYNGQEKNVIIPNFYNGKRVTKISSTTFKNCTSLTSVIIPEGITIIDDYAFNNLQSLIIYVKASSEQSGWGYLWNGGRPVYYAITEVLEYNDMQYIIIDGNITITRYFGYETILDVPSKIREYNVTSIGDDAFSNCINLINITIPEGITSIGDGAFYNCSSLSNITIPEGITSIGNGAFSNCTSLSNITIPEGITSIGNGAFSNCTSLKNITIPKGITRIADSTFQDCTNLTSITIPEGVTTIGHRAFNNCTSLASITLPNGLTSIGYNAFYNCISLINIIIPEGVNYIGGSAFADCVNLRNITIPEGVTNIISYTFINCKSLISVNIPESVESIGNNVFSGCTSLTSIFIPEGVTIIDDSIFNNCDKLVIYVKNSSIPSGWSSEWNSSNRPVYYGVEEVFEYNGIQYLIIEGNITITRYIGNATSLIIPSKIGEYKVTSIGDYAFSYCDSLTSIFFLEGITSIGDGAFYNCSSLSNITIPKGITQIGNYTFSHCYYLTSISIPEGVTRIGKYAFSDCSSLISITIPEGVTYIGDYAFSSCYSLKSIIIPEGVTSIEKYTFYKCDSLTNITIPEGVISIGDYAFYNCSSLSNITIPRKVTRIGNFAFSNCDNLISISIPEGLKSIGDETFYNCTSLNSIIIPVGVISIGEDAFRYCSQLIIYAKASQEPNDWGAYWHGGRPVYYGVKEVKEYNDMQYLIIEEKITITRYLGNETTLDIPLKIGEYEVTSIGVWAFYNCTSLTSITIPKGLAIIGDSAFRNCKNLVRINIPEGVSYIGDHAFGMCSSLTIYAEVSSQPSGWSLYWNSINRPIVWNSKLIY